MNWQSWQAFVAMGGYGFYVWGSVLVVAAFIVGELADVVRRRHAALKTLRLLGAGR